jgi:hypothetical protein
LSSCWRPWLHLAFQSNAFDTEIINSVFMTVLDNGLVTLNFSATVGEYPGYKARSSAVRGRSR